MSTSRVLEDVAHRAGLKLIRTAVGEANVVQGIRASDALMGGEGNGGVIDPRIGWVRDPFIGMGLILEHLARHRQSLVDAVKQLPRYTMRKLKVDLPLDRWPIAAEQLVRAFQTVASIDRTDGVRIAWPDQWLHVRPSNTEPIVRIIAESPTDASVDSLCEATQRILRERIAS
jgi:phosphomannomutase